MKKSILLGIVFALLITILPASTEAAVRVKGYTTSRGTYVAPSYRSSPNRTTYDNYSTKGNYNPYTGKSGTKNYYGW